MPDYIELKIKLKSYRRPIIIEFEEVNILTKFMNDIKSNEIIVFGQLIFNKEDFQSAIITYKENAHVRHKHNRCKK